MSGAATFMLPSLNPFPTGPRPQRSGTVNHGTPLHTPPAAPHSGPNGMYFAGQCQQCHTKPQRRDGVKTHPFCGKRCADEWARLNAGQSPATGAQAAPTTTQASGNMCDSCHKKPKKMEGGKLHPFCSKSCAKVFHGRQGKRGSRS
jgi:endogenous inhibitor of DNA gyrase (YacG/DUF329 family)